MIVDYNKSNIDKLYEHAYNRFREIKSKCVSSCSISEDVRYTNENFDIKWISIYINNSLTTITYKSLSTKLILKYHKKAHLDKCDYIFIFENLEELNRILETILKEENVLYIEEEY